MPAVATPRGMLQVKVSSQSPETECGHALFSNKPILTQDTLELGNPENTISNQEHAKGISTPTFENSHADQKVGTSNGPAAQYSKAHYGNEKGK